MKKERVQGIKGIREGFKGSRDQGAKGLGHLILLIKKPIFILNLVSPLLTVFIVIQSFPPKSDDFYNLFDARMQGFFYLIRQAQGLPPTTSNPWPLDPLTPFLIPLNPSLLFMKLLYKFFHLRNAALVNQVTVIRLTFRNIVANGGQHDFFNLGQILGLS